MAVVKGTPRGVWRAHMKGFSPVVWPGETFDPVFIEGDEGREVQVKDPETGEYFIISPEVVAELAALRRVAYVARSLRIHPESDHLRADLWRALDALGPEAPLDRVDGEGLPDA